MKLAGKAIERFLTRPDPAILAALLFGPESGLIRDRADHLLGHHSQIWRDPFAFTPFDGAALSKDPGGFTDAALTLPLGQKLRLLHVRDASDTLAGPLELILSQEPSAAIFLVVEAGELGPASPLRKLCESHPRAAAIGCYAEEGADLAQFLQNYAKDHQIRFSPEAVNYISVNLTGNRLLLKTELEKLCLYKQGEGPSSVIDLEDVEAALSDVAQSSSEMVAILAASGQLPPLMVALDRAFREGESSIGLLRAALRHFLRLHWLAGLCQSGMRGEEAIAKLRPPVFFRHRPLIERQLRVWAIPDLDRALKQIQETEISCKHTGMPAEFLCRQLFLRLGHYAARLSR